MIATLAFVGLAGMFMLIGQAYLRTASWPRRAPRLGIALWQALSGAVVACLMLACLSLILPGMSAAATMSEVLHACAVGLKQRYSSPEGAALSTAGVGLFLFLVLRLQAALWSNHRSARRSRRDHLARLALVARPDTGGVYSIDHQATAVYCLPKSRLGSGADAIVVTTGAREALTSKQLRLVLRHERAHLRSRHDRLVLRSRSLADALPWFPFFRAVREQIAELVELHADDAIAPQDRPELAGAIYRLAGGGTRIEPAASLSAARPAASIRVGRLVRPQVPLRRSGAALVMAAIAAIGVAPAALAIFPTGAFSHHCCERPGQASLTAHGSEVPAHSALLAT